jgi:hypothetical protein
MNQSTRSRIAAALVPAAIVVAMASGCGEAFSSAGGAGGSGGSSAPSSGVSGAGATATSSSDVSSSGSGSGTECTWSSGNCPSNEYCKDIQCEDGTGKCALRTMAKSLAYEPVCGCNGLSFWNASVASTYGMSVHHTGVCSSMDEAVPCTGESECASYGAGCMLQALSCTANPAGICMVPHDSCDLTSPMAQNCENTCKKVCTLIETSAMFHSPGGC